ncbi:MAG: glycosyltransferase family 2 protein [Prevotellaceae bacterium]|jgi:rhamnosyltransferase|nr:glycosyltransferase family 2 protein [Prevotellaceae bacterium]
MIIKKNLWGIVIWYNPTSDNVLKMKTYMSEIDRLIIIDNSSTDNSHLLSEEFSTPVIYIPNMDNKGIATALNQGCRRAIEGGAEWVLTMDQDSWFSEGDLSEMITKANKYQHFNEVAIFAPMPHYSNNRKNEKNIDHREYIETTKLITSGNLLSLSAYKHIKPFCDDLFIDMVDYEFCFRATRLYYKLITITSVSMNHCLGDGSYNIRILWIKKVVDDHNPVRRYYIARNTLYVRDLYPEHAKWLSQYFRRQFKRILLYDHRNKWKKLRYMIKGVVDYRHGIKGRIDLRNK